ncbi:MAG: IgA Peptidase M64 [Thermoanaerobaculia bacterium]|nr:IgA Peptidase M64 [Thermoanaerobaculia bacterium]
MKRIFVLALSLLALPLAAHSPDFDEHFIDKTMRVDIFHTGGMGKEIVALDQVVSDGPWPGSTTQLIDHTNLGKFMVEVIDPSTNQVIYSRGFATIYGEWETTAESRTTHRTFHESLRFPWPKHPVQVVLKKREPQQGFHEIWSTVVEPDSRFVNPSDIEPVGDVWTLFENGHPHQKVDLLLIGEGYTAVEKEKFHRDAKRLTEALFAEEPFKSRRDDFNVRAIDLPSAESGISRPRAGKFRRSLTGSQYNIFDSERYLLTYDNQALRDIASAAPYDFLEILVNEEQYGGGGIYNFQATTSVDTGFAEYVFIHEFGHHFAALGDEYFTSSVAYETGAEYQPEPWEPNITALHDPENLKWGDLVDDSTPLPTPWPKEEYMEKSREFQAERAELRARNAPESEIDELFRKEKAWMEEFLGSQKYSEVVGAFEGASYEPEGLYRPEIDCIMFTRDDVGFCRVCQRGIETIIDLYSE